MYHDEFVLRTEKYALKYNMFDDCDVIIAGLSGGADSVCLLKVLKELSAKYRFEIEAVHVHHGIRGEEADRDASFAKKLCDDNDIPFLCVSVNVPLLAKELGASEEEAGRIVRYETFEGRVKEYEGKGKKAKIAVAHNLNDNAETVLFNLFRGSKIDGLAGIKPVNGYIIRPLLNVTRDDIEQYLISMGTSFCTDSTNLSEEYTRNIIRHRILPVAKEINNAAAVHVAGAAADVAGARDFIDICSNNAYDKIVHAKKDDDDNIISVEASVNELLGEHPFIIRRIIRKMVGEVAGKLKDIEEIHISICEDILSGSTGRRANLPYDMVVCRDYDRFIVCKKHIRGSYNSREKSVVAFTLDDNSKKALFDKEGLTVKVVTGIYRMWIDESTTFIKDKNNYTKMFDYDKIKCDFSIRKRQQGDHIIINESGNVKKLNRFFIDNKVPVDVRENIYMLCAESEVLFVPGYRSSEGYRITDTTKRTLKVTFIPDEEK